MPSPQPSRALMFREMSTLVSTYAPWKLNAYRYENIVVYPWVIGYKYNAIAQHPWQYYDIDMKISRTPVAP